MCRERESYTSCTVLTHTCNSYSYSEHNLLTYDQLRERMLRFDPDSHGSFPEEPCEFKPSIDDEFHRSQAATEEEALTARGMYCTN